MAKKYIALFMTAVMLITCFTACSSEEAENKSEQTATTQKAKVTDNTTFKLSYTQSDSLDPFKAKTQNNQVLASLVFESLFELDENYEPVNDIALDYEYKDDKQIKVKINNNIKFSDGSALDTDDVVYSFEAAKDSPAYKNSLKYIDYASASGDSVTFYLDRENPYAVNLLTFPIASIYDDDDGYPVGSGRYKYENSDGKTILTANVTDEFNPYITTVNLVNIAAADSIDNAVNIGNISYAFRDLSSSVSKRMSCAKKLVNMNNLVYLGVNSYAGITANPQIRKAISLACDRKVFAQSAYSGYASCAASPFNPAGKLAQNIKIFSDTADVTTAKQSVFQSAVDAKDLKIRILVNKNDNRASLATLLKSQLEAVGFTVTVELEETKEYMRKIRNVEFDIYIGEVKLSDDMSLYPFFEKGGVSFGIDKDKFTCDELYSDYLSGDADLGKFILAFNEELPFIPLLYKNGMICYSKAMNGDMQGYYGNFFSNIDTWNFIS